MKSLHLIVSLKNKSIAIDYCILPHMTGYHTIEYEWFADEGFTDTGSKTVWATNKENTV